MISSPIPIDARARNGRNQLLLERPVEQAGNFALGRWDACPRDGGEPRWAFPNGADLPFTPTLYVPRKEDLYA